MTQKQPPAKQDPPTDTTTPTTTKTKKPTPTELKAELEDLRESAATTRQRLTKSEVTLQKARNILKSDGSPGMTLTQDHYRLSQMVAELRKLLDVTSEVEGNDGANWTVPNRG